MAPIRQFGALNITACLLGQEGVGLQLGKLATQLRLQTKDISMSSLEDGEGFIQIHRQMYALQCIKQLMKLMCILFVTRSI